MQPSSSTSRDLSRDDEGGAYTERLMNGRQRALFLVLASLWAGSFVYAWQWWLRPEHIEDGWRYAYITAILVWQTGMPVYSLVNLGRAVRPVRRSYPLPGVRVAMVVTKAPSEPFSVLRETLEAMLRQDYPHDTWLADEDPAPETIRWCDAHGVRISTRRGREDYHRKTWPRRTRCKEGNLAFFYDQYGYENYDFVAQFDADHVPEPTYLARIMDAFRDPEVGYVSAPSICDRNAARSWSARGRLYVEGMLHGPVQAGNGARGLSLCFGSHYAVRTAALREAGGLGPELAEDHSTSMLISAAGWKSAHAIDAIAHGDGPQNFADMATQEFQWSRSMMNVLLRHTPRYLPALPMGRRVYFVFCQLWYPLFALFSLMIFAAPLIALATGKAFAPVTFIEFTLHFAPMGIVLVAIVLVMRSFGLARPYDAKVVSWEGNLFMLYARWPWALRGVLTGLWDRATNVYVDFRVTPKGDGPRSLLPTGVVMPYALLAAVSAATALGFDSAPDSRGFMAFAALNAVVYAGLVVLILAMHLRENRIRIRERASRFAGQVALVSGLALCAAFVVRTHALEGIYALESGSPLQLVRVVYPAFGAGKGSDNDLIFTLMPRWAVQ
jgi:cellulose synthase/poly-beta-1,6-N-acetylglucosamine synthase-like glycosyltransferase